MDLLSIYGFIALAVSFLVGMFSKKLSGPLIKAAGISKEIGELLTEFANDAADGNLTKEEILRILDAADDIPAALKAVKKKG